MSHYIIFFSVIFGCFSIACEMLLHYVFELYYYFVFFIDCLIVHESAHSTYATSACDLFAVMPTVAADIKVQYPLGCSVTSHAN